MDILQLDAYLDLNSFHTKQRGMPHEIMAKSDNEQPLPSAKKAEFCSSCKDLMNGIDNLKALLQPGGVRLCSGPGQQDRCALRAISLASVRAWNDRHPKDKLLDDRDPSINVVALLKKGEKKGSHDITQLALRQRCDETSVDLLRLSVRAVSGESFVFCPSQPKSWKCELMA